MPTTSPVVSGHKGQCPAAAVFQGTPDWSIPVETLCFTPLSVFISAMWQQYNPVYPCRMLGQFPFLHQNLPWLLFAEFIL